MDNPAVELIYVSTILILDRDGISKLKEILTPPLVTGPVLPRDPNPDTERAQPLILSVEGAPMMDRVWELFPMSMGVRLSVFNHQEMVLTLFVSDTGEHDMRKFTSDVLDNVYTVEKIYVIGSECMEESWFYPVTYITLDEFSRAVREALSREYGRHKRRGRIEDVDIEPGLDDIVYPDDEY